MINDVPGFNEHTPQFIPPMVEDGPKPKRILIHEMILAGDATKDGIREALKLTKSSLATNWTALRLMGYYPYEVDEDSNVLAFTDAVGWKMIKDAREAKANTRRLATQKPPQERYENAYRRVVRANKALGFAEERATAEPDNELLDLKQQKVEIEIKIATLELDNIMELFKDEITLIEDKADAVEEVEGREGDGLV